MYYTSIRDCSQRYFHYYLNWFHQTKERGINTPPSLGSGLIDCPGKHQPAQCDVKQHRQGEDDLQLGLLPVLYQGQ